MQAVILAGGKGSRLAERLNGLPKPLVSVGGVPLLERQLLALEAQGVESVIILVNHAADQIVRFVAERQGDLQVTIIDDGAPRGTAGAVLACLDQLDPTFLVVYGDTLFDIDVRHMERRHRAMRADVTLLLHPNDHPADSDLVEMDPAGWVTAFHGYPHPPGTELRNLVNAAFYICEKGALQAWRDAPAPLDFAKDLFPRMLEGGAHFAGYSSYEYIKDLGTPKRLDKAERHLAEGRVERSSRRHRQPAVFLDRDGVLNAIDRGQYIRSPDDLVLLDGVEEAVQRLNDAEYRVVLVTNQPVVARGECDEVGLQRIHARLETTLGRKGAWLDAIYFCPHHPDYGFEGERPDLKIVCGCRKPATGMFVQAAEDLNIDLERSWVIGDSTSDIAAAHAMNLPSVLVMTGEGGRDGRFTAEPTMRVRDLAEAVDRLLVEVGQAGMGAT